MFHYSNIHLFYFPLSTKIFNLKLLPASKNAFCLSSNTLQVNILLTNGHSITRTSLSLIKFPLEYGK